MFVDGFLTDEQGAESIEFGLVLRRSPIDLPSADLAKFFAESFQEWHASRQRALHRPQAAEEQVTQLQAAVDDLEARLAAADAHIAAAEAALTALNRDMQALLSTKTMRYTSRLRKLYGRLRRT